MIILPIKLANSECHRSTCPVVFPYAQPLGASVGGWQKRGKHVAGSAILQALIP